MAGDSVHPVRLMNFVSQDQLEESKRTRGERLEDGTAQRDKPLYEILRENKEKKDAEFNERFKHRPPKALDEDETEFLDKLEASRREYERQLADEEEQQLRSFQAAVASQSTVLRDVEGTPPLLKVEEGKPNSKRNPPSHSLKMVIKVKPQAKKAKTDAANVEEPSGNAEKSLGPAKAAIGDIHDGSINSGLVSYSDESEDDDLYVD